MENTWRNFIQKHWFSGFIWLILGFLMLFLCLNVNHLYQKHWIVDTKEHNFDTENNELFDIMEAIYQYCPNTSKDSMFLSKYQTAKQKEVIKKLEKLIDKKKIASLKTTTNDKQVARYKQGIIVKYVDNEKNRYTTNILIIVALLAVVCIAPYVVATEEEGNNNRRGMVWLILSIFVWVIRDYITLCGNETPRIENIFSLCNNALVILAISQVNELKDSLFLSKILHSKYKDSVLFSCFEIVIGMIFALFAAYFCFTSTDGKFVDACLSLISYTIFIVVLGFAFLRRESEFLIFLLIVCYAAILWSQCYAVLSTEIPFYVAAIKTAYKTAIPIMALSLHYSEKKQGFKIKILELEGKNKEINDKNKEINDKNKEINDKNKEINDKNKELEDKNKELEDKNKELEDKNKELSTSELILREANDELNLSKSELIQKKEEIEKERDFNNTLFVALVHDIKNVINSMGFNIQTLENMVQGDKFIDEKEQTSRMIQKKRQEILYIAENLSMMAKRNFNIENMRLKETITHILTKIDTSLTSTVNIPDDMQVICDKVVLEICLRNLFNNAYNARASEMFFKIDETQTNFPRLLIKDNGCGVAEELRPYLFREKINISSNNNRLGIGLLSCARLLKICDASIFLTDRDSLDGGASFAIDFQRNH